MATIDEMPEIAEMRTNDTPLESNFHSLSTPTVQRADTTSTPTPATTASDVPNSTRSSGGYENNFKRPPLQSAFNNARNYTYQYRAALGSLLWYCRRNFPQLRAAVTLLATYASAPTNYHVNCIKRVLKYLHTHARDTIHYARDATFNRARMTLQCFTDSDWAADRTSRRSMSGFLIYMNNNLVSTGCKFHPTQCLSTMEAEYMGETYVSKDILFIDNLISELNPVYSIAHPVQLFGDNNAALKFAEERTVNDRVKHIDLRHHFLMSLVDRGVISMNFVSTTDNIDR
jgi:hypothetical protein